MLRLHACFSPRLCFTQMCAFYVARAPFQRNIIFLIFLYHGWVLLLIYFCIFYYSFFRILRLNSSFFFFFLAFIYVFGCARSQLWHVDSFRCSMWGPGTPVKDWTRASCVESSESATGPSEKSLLLPFPSYLIIKTLHGWAWTSG